MRAIHSGYSSRDFKDSPAYAGITPVRMHDRIWRWIAGVVSEEDMRGDYERRL